MKIFEKKSIVTVVVAFFVFGLIGLVAPNTALAATVPALGTARNFAVLSGTAITDTTPSDITGDVGASPITGAAIGIPSTEVIGTIYSTDGAGTGDVMNPGLLTTAKVDAKAAYDNVVGQGSDFAVVASDTDSFAAFLYVLTPGVYTSGSTMGVPVALTLDGGGNPNAVFIFQAGSTLKTVAGSVITLTNGAQARNVFWQVGSAATFGTTSTFSGTVMAVDAITDAGGAIINGRLLADADNDGTGAVTLNNTTVTVPTSLTLAKNVVNDNGGTALPAAWTLTADGPTTPISGASGAVAVTNKAVLPGTYDLSESGGPAGYTAALTYSCVTNGGAAVLTNSPAIVSGDNVVCTITNNDIAPILHLIKLIVGGGPAVLADFQLTANGAGANDISGTSPVNSGAGLLADTFALSETNPGGYTASAWGCVGGAQVGSNITLGINQVATCTITNTRITPPLSPGYTPPVPPLIDVVKVPSPLALPGGSGSVNYGYTLTNIGTVPVTDITMVDDSCSPLTLTSGDSNSDAILDLTETWIYHCSKTLSATHTNIVTATGWANGVSATDLASATVVVGVPIVPPLIHITKVPSPLTLGAGGGLVTYTKKVTNPGTVPLSNVHVTDSKCSPINYVSGDTNSNSMLEPSETWTYTCQTNLTATTTNTAIATGTANGLTATDFAIATVVVAGAVVYTVPSLPNTGVAPTGSGMAWLIVMAGIFAVLIAIYFIRKKQTE